MSGFANLFFKQDVCSDYTNFLLSGTCIHFLIPRIGIYLLVLQFLGEYFYRYGGHYV